jgi:hypothetical protein
MKWPTTRVKTSEGLVDAVAPAIVSASRSTDIPAFYAKWFMNRLCAGYSKWVNPFNQKPQYVSFERTKVVVFWSKNPAPLIPLLDEIDRRRIEYYFQFTVNDYEKERLESGLPSLDQRIQTFLNLSKMIGPERVIWRFDPLILVNDVSVDELLSRIRVVGDRIAGHTSKLVFSFADIEAYRKVKGNLTRTGYSFREFSDEEMEEAAAGIAELCCGWQIDAATCAEKVDLGKHSITHNKCVDDELILKITNNDPDLLRLLGRSEAVQGSLLGDLKTPLKSMKDKGQREECGCVISKDIGQYNTCRHLCVYCYANTSATAVRRAIEKADPQGESILS